MADREMTLAQYLVRKVGLVKTMKVATFVVAWGIYTEKVKGPHTLDGYSAYWKQSVATTYRERDLFRIAFSGDQVPDRVWAHVREVYAQKLDQRGRDVGVADVLSVSGGWS